MTHDGHEGCHWYGGQDLCPCSVCPFKEIEGHCLLFDPPETWHPSFFKRMEKLTGDQKNKRGGEIQSLLKTRGYPEDRVYLIMVSMGELQGRA
ncbi:MAG: hypothetical protein A2X80_04495 [Geobacteraceae bacterium GWB2_52_12]|nr:MAG: hypothetical protein A2X80_04495 [Geobacteraceae bacterium GWB2_52_12]